MFDARLTPEGLSDADLDTLEAFGVRGGLLVPAAAPSLEALADTHAAALHQRERLTRRGLEAATCVTIPLSLAGEKGASAALAALPRRLASPGAAVIGPLMLHRATDAERRLFLELAKLAHEFARPLLVTAPIARHQALTTKTLALLHEARVNPKRVLFDGLTDETVRAVLARGFFAGLTLHPDRLDVDVGEALVHALGPERLVLGSGAGDGPSDLLALPRLAARLKKARLSQGVIGRVSARNLVGFLGSSFESWLQRRDGGLSKL